MLTILLGIAMAVTVAVAVYLVGSLAASIRKERRTEGVKRIWASFALSIAFCILFFGSWFAQGLAQWHEFVRDQQDHGEAVVVQDFMAEFTARTLENWQSEFLQLFSFVVLSALFIHHGSAESKDSNDRMEARLERIEKVLKEGSP